MTTIASVGEMDIVCTVMFILFVIAFCYRMNCVNPPSQRNQVEALTVSGGD